MSIIPILAGPTDPQFLRILNDRLREIDSRIGSGGASTAVASGDGWYAGTHAQRVKSYPATIVPLGSVFWEFDRGLLYVCTRQYEQGQRWLYLAGEMSGTISPDQKPTGLGSDDTGLRFRSTDVGAHVYRWDGAAWQYADEPGGQFAFYDADPAASTGWVKCAGQTVTASTATGGTRSVTLPSSDAYVKGANAYSSAKVAAVAPGLTGDTADASAGTPTGSVGAGSFTGDVQNTGTPSSTTNVTQGTGGTITVASTGHTHSYQATGSVTSGAFTGDAMADHKHGKGTLAVDATAEPAHYDAVLCFRL